jgi:hypothetical protein
MTTDVLRLPGDYRIEAKSSSSTSFTIDSPNINITGNLNVIGTVTNIVTTNTNISDNIITLNSGETNQYVTKDVSGLLIARGNNDSLNNAATFLYNDNTSSGGVWVVGAETNRGIFEFAVENKTSAIKVNAIRIGSNVNKLNFIGENSTATLSVSGTYNYEDNVQDDDDIPNLKYVRDYLNVNQDLNITGNLFVNGYIYSTVQTCFIDNLNNTYFQYNEINTLTISSFYNNLYNIK